MKEVTWTATNKNGRYEDHLSISLGPDLSKVFAETMQVSPSKDADVFKDAVSTTRYNLKDPQIAWRSALLAAQSKTDALSGKLIVAFSSSLFEPYAIEDPEMFLSGVGSVLETVRFEAEGDDVAVVARVKDIEKVKKSVAKE